MNVQEETRKINNIMSTKRKCVSKMHSFLLSRSAGCNRTLQCGMPKSYYKDYEAMLLG